MVHDDAPLGAEPPIDPDEREVVESGVQPSAEEPDLAHAPDPSVLELVESPIEGLLGGFDVEERDAEEAEEAEVAEVAETQAPGQRPATATDAASAGTATAATGAATGTVTSAGSAAATPGAPARRGPTVRVSGSRGRLRKVRTQVGDEEAADRRKARKGAAFMGVVFLIYLVWIVVTGQADEFVASLATADYGWLGIGLLFMVVRFAFGTLAYVFAVYIDPDSPVGVRDCMSVEASGTLFGNLTPMNSGAVPAQIYRLTKAGLDVGEASATQFTRFIFYQAGEVVVAAVLLWLKFDFFLTTYGNFVILNLVVFVIQTAQAGGLLIVCLFPRMVVRIGNWALRLARRHGWMRPETVERYSRVINVQVDEFAFTFRQSFRHKTSLFLTWLVTLGMLVCFYSVPWCVLRAMGGDADFLECLAAGAMVQMIGNSVPLPGGAGGNEAGFAFFFGPVFGTSAAAGFVVWRLITFFIPTGACLPLSALRSSTRRSIYQRWNTFRSQRGRRATYTFTSHGRRR